MSPRPTAYLSVISHHQEDLVTENFKNFPKKLGRFDIKLAIMDNTGSDMLKAFCEREKHFYYHDGIVRGFGHNHNKMFQLLAPGNEDIFIICNPDITVAPDQLEGLLENFVTSGIDIGAPRSYLDKAKGQLDYPDRYFPCLANFLISIATGKRLHYGTYDDQEYPEWFSGSFILFKPEVFQNLGGFDEGYHMYCEDIDLCYRAKQAGYKLKLDTAYHIEHHSRMASRKLLSKNIWWHIRSAFRFSLKSKRLFCLSIAKRRAS